MQIIAKSKPEKNTWQSRKYWLIALVLLFGAAIAISIFAVNSMAMTVIIFVFAAALAGLFFKIMKPKPATTVWEEQGILYFRFPNLDENRTQESRTVSFVVPAIKAYKIHSYLGMVPAILEIGFLTSKGKVEESRPILIEFLDKEQQEMLFRFLDALISKSRRLS